MKYVLVWMVLISSGASACDRYVNIHPYAHGAVAVIKGAKLSISQDGKTDEYEMVRVKDPSGVYDTMYTAFDLPRSEDEAGFRVYRHGKAWVIDEDAYEPKCD